MRACYNLLRKVWNSLGEGWLVFFSAVLIYGYCQYMARGALDMLMSGGIAILQGSIQDKDFSEKKERLCTPSSWECCPW